MEQSAKLKKGIILSLANMLVLVVVAYFFTEKLESLEKGSNEFFGFALMLVGLISMVGGILLKQSKDGNYD